jgi:hypothetical protein
VPLPCFLDRKVDESGRLPKLEKQGEVALEVLGDQEIFLYVVVATFAETPCNIRVGEQETNLVGSAFHGVSEQAGMIVDDLGGDSTNGGSDHGFLFPKGFGDGEAESFAQAFLDDDGGSALQGVHFERRPGREFEKLDVGIAFGGMLRFLQNCGAFGIVGGAATRENKLTIEIAADDAVSANDANGILETVEAGDLRENGAKMVDAIAC